jgi:hypothetical protein
MIGLIVSMLGGVLALVGSLALGVSVLVAFLIGAGAGLVVFVGLVSLTIRFYTRVQASLEVMFPTPSDEVEVVKG